MKKFIAYARVSTEGQGIGLEAQKEIIAKYVAQQPGGGMILQTIQEKESGKDTINRPGLQKAIALAKQTGATLIVAKLDRLSRDIADIFNLKKIKGLSFDVCDMDAQDTLTLGIFATLAQKERELISRRTKEALAALKAQGKQLGNPNAAEAMRAINAKGVAKRQQLAKDAAENRHAYNAVRLMQGTLQAKADFLNSEGYTTRNGCSWTPMGVKRLFDRYAK